MKLGPLQRLRGVRRLSLRSLVTVALAATGLLLGGCASYTQEGNVNLFVQTAPLPTLVPHGRQLAAAEQAAALHTGDFALQGSGHSMEPVYLADTALVVHPTAFHMLRKGMAVVYTNARGASVAHMLVEKTANGWLAMGLNNAEPDDALVTPTNLVGIVKQAYAPADGVYRADISVQIALRSAVEKGHSIALLH